MKKLIAILCLGLSTAAFSAQKLKCSSNHGYLISGELTGYQLKNVKFNNAVAETDFSMPFASYTKQMDMFSSKKFDPEMPYPQYHLKYNLLLSLPGGDMRNGSFVALLIVNERPYPEFELNCQTTSL